MMYDNLQRLVPRRLVPDNISKTRGARLPPEMMSYSGVREAIVRLRSEGLLVSRQGVGVFVSDNAAQRRFEVDWDGIRTLPQLIALLEMRLAVEVESAGLCEVRCTKSGAKEIRRWMEQTNSQACDPETSKVNYDFDFHLRIARATENTYFHQLLAVLQPIIVPRIKLSTLTKGEHKEEYYRLINDEHEAIVAAIERKDEDAAREKMRAHLPQILARVHNLAASFGWGARARRTIASRSSEYATTPATSIAATCILAE